MADDQHSSDDPATRLLKRVVLGVVIGGFVGFHIPRFVDGFGSGDLSRQFSAAVGLAFWAWLSWRIVVLIRTRGAGENPRYYFISGMGYAAFFAIYVVSLIWRGTSGDSDGRAVPFTVLVLGLTVASLAAGRRLSRNVVSADSAEG